jgi:hypothetical protein
LSTQLFSLLYRVKDKNVLHGVQIDMDELKKWKVEDQNTPTNFPKMNGRENKLNHTTLNIFQTIRTTLENNISALISN